MDELSGLVIPDNRRKAKWVECATLVSRSKDVCKPGSWVFFKKPASLVRNFSNIIVSCSQHWQLSGTSTTLAGRITKILAPEFASADDPVVSVALIDHFEVLAINDARLNMPLLVRSGQVEIAHTKVRN
jgi:hypothetical protein